MSDALSSKVILSELLEILFSYLKENIKDTRLDFSKKNDKIRNLINKLEIKGFEFKIEKTTFESKVLYKNILLAMNAYSLGRYELNFNSSYSTLYFYKIIHYLQKLLKSNIDISEDETVKIYFFLILLYSYHQRCTFIPDKKKLVLDSAFYKGTFIELENKYSKDVPYKEIKENGNDDEPEEIKEFIINCKDKMKSDLTNLIDQTFSSIKQYLDNYGNESDELIISMKNDVKDILFNISSSGFDLSKNFIQYRKIFYSQKEYLIFNNFICDTDENNIDEKIDSSFIKSIENKYIDSNFSINSSNIKDNKTKLNEYLEHNKKYYRRMLLNINKILDIDFEDEVNMFSLIDSHIVSRFSPDFELFYQFKNKLKIENIYQDKILRNIRTIIDDNEFYKTYFSILRSDVVKNFFTSNLYLKDDNSFEFELLENKIENSECFDEIYNNFLDEYDKGSENYTSFKKLLILKILPLGDRAYTISFLKKIVINPSQFFIGSDIKDNNIINEILQGYLMVILLHETEHYFRLLNKNGKVLDSTPRDKEGGRLFIKYIFDVYSINHINNEQAKSILNLNNWKTHKKLKNIFSGELEDYDKDNIDDFISKQFTNSISFYSRKYNKGNSKKSTFIKK
jgi:hypothetical protein